MALHKIEEDKKERDKKALNVFLIKYFKWLVLLVVILIFLTSYLFLLNPRYEQILVSIGEGIEQKKQNLIKKDIELENLKNLIAVYHLIDKSDIERIDYLLPEKSSHEALLSQIESLVRKNGLLLLSLNFSDSENIKNTTKDLNIEFPDEVGVIKISFNVAGADYNGLKNLLTAFENNLRLMDITHLSFSPTDSSIEIKLQTYYLKKN